MKFFDTDWGGVRRWLAVWERMSPAVRRHYLLVTPAHTQLGQDAACWLDNAGLHRLD